MHTTELPPQTPPHINNDNIASTDQGVFSELREDELSPEELEEIMAKVKDVNEKGTAATVLRTQKHIPEVQPDEIYRRNLSAMSSVMEFGLLGTDKFRKYEEKMSHWSEDKSYDPDIKDAWILDSRVKRMGAVFTHIIGRDIPTLSKAFFKDGDYGIIFNLDAFNEHNPHSEGPYKELINAAKTKSYRGRGTFDSESFYLGIAATRFGHKKVRKVYTELGLGVMSIDYKTFIQLLNNKKEILEQNDIDAEMFISAAIEAGSFESLFGNPIGPEGFMLTRRVAPKYFDGIFLNQTMPSSTSEGDTTEPEEERKEIDEKVHNIATLMIEKKRVNNKKQVLPIYDLNGNLLWPKQMTHEEVVEFVAEREKQKK